MNTDPCCIQLIIYLVVEKGKTEKFSEQTSSGSCANNPNQVRFLNFYSSQRHTFASCSLKYEYSVCCAQAAQQPDHELEYCCFGVTNIQQVIYIRQEQSPLRWLPEKIMTSQFRCHAWCLRETGYNTGNSGRRRKMNMRAGQWFIGMFTIALLTATAIPIRS
jgi:hypothetical protein